MKNINSDNSIEGKCVFIIARHHRVDVCMKQIVTCAEITAAQGGDVVGIGMILVENTASFAMNDAFLRGLECDPDTPLINGVRRFTRHGVCEFEDLVKQLCERGAVMLVIDRDHDGRR